MLREAYSGSQIIIKSLLDLSLKLPSMVLNNNPNMSFLRKIQNKTITGRKGIPTKSPFILGVFVNILSGNNVAINP